jgi:hypothetical protein
MDTRPDPLKFRWAPKVRPDKVWRLYQADARGIVDEALIDDVGVTLLLRCRSILMATAGEAECPHCGRTIPFAGMHTLPDVPVLCPGCGWETTYRRFHASWRHRELYGGNAVAAFRRFVEHYPHAAAPRQRMLLIDRLIHAFHVTLKGSVNRAAVVNLIEGSTAQVLDLLERLAYGDGSTPGLGDTKAAWRAVRAPGHRAGDS